jgi:hypothetical protein
MPNYRGDSYTIPSAMHEAADWMESITCKYIAAVKDEASPRLTWRGDIESEPLNMAKARAARATSDLR